MARRIVTLASVAGLCALTGAAALAQQASRAPAKPAAKPAAAKAKPAAAKPTAAKPAAAKPTAAKPAAAKPTAVAAAPAQAEIDKPVRDFKLRDLTADKETYHTLSQYRGKKAVIAVFLSNRCGTTWKYENRMGKLIQDYAKKDVVVLGIHSNAPESNDEIRKYAESRNFDAPVLDDKVSNEFVEYFGARATPTILVIDKNGVLRYRGAYDDNDNEAAVKTRYAENALDAILDNKEVPVKTTRAFG